MVTLVTRREHGVRSQMLLGLWAYLLVGVAPRLLIFHLGNEARIIALDDPRRIARAQMIQCIVNARTNSG